MYASPARSTLLSGALHAAAIALILFATGIPTSMVKAPDHTTLIMPLDVLKYEVAPERADAGGGGGMHAPTPASAGNLPRRALKQFLAPMVKSENPNPILTIEPAIIANPEIVVTPINLAQFGDPHGVIGPRRADAARAAALGMAMAPAWARAKVPAQDRGGTAESPPPVPAFRDRSPTPSFFGNPNPSIRTKRARPRCRARS